MAQSTHIIDLRRSFLPVAPDAMPVTMHATAGEDQPEARIPVVAYDGYNFMPTPQGYSSFFGTNARFDAPNINHANAIPAVYGPDVVTYPVDEPTAQAWFVDWFWGAPGHTWPETRLAGYLANTDAELLANTGQPDLMAFFYWQANVDITAAFGPTTSVPGSLLTAEIPENIGTTGGVDDLFMIQSDRYANVIVALCEDGIFTKRSENAGWIHEVTLAKPELHRQWSKCVIDNIVYIYRETEAYVWLASPANGYVFTQSDVVGVNMAGQLGIFRAGGRLAFWDSENATGWSSITEPLEFGDADKLSGFTVFQDIVGRIVTVLQHGDGFIIYCTRSIVGVRRNVGSPLLFAGSAIFANNGISYRREVAVADPDTVHFAFTTQGLAQIEAYKPEIIVPEISTYLKEKREPVFLKMLNGRYLFVEMLSLDYFAGITTFSGETTEARVYEFAAGSKALGDMGNPLRAAVTADRSFDSVYLNRTYGFTNRLQTNSLQRVPIWRDNIATIIPFSELSGYKDFTPGFFGDPAYFENKYTARGSVAKIDGTGNIFLIPQGVPLATEYAQVRRQEANDNSFYSRQEMAWWTEERYYTDWLKNIEDKDYGSYQRQLEYGASPSGVPFLPRVGEVESIDHDFGPFLIPTFQCEADRYYGTADKSAWLQRSIVKGVKLTINEKLTQTRTFVEAHWAPSLITMAPPNPSQGFAVPMNQVLVLPDYNGALTSQAAVVNWMNAVVAPASGGFWTADFTAGPGTPATDSGSIVLGTALGAGLQRTILISVHGTSAIDGAQDRYITLTPIKGAVAVAPPVGFGGFGNQVPAAYTVDGVTIGTAIIGEPVLAYTYTQTQKFHEVPHKDYVDFDTCVYKELGYTDITGHGAYTGVGGSFVQLDSITEAADYTDFCDSDPNKKRRPLMNGFPVGRLLGPGGPVTVTRFSGVPWTYPDTLPLDVPSGTIVLQDGSIDPPYPTFVGAFVFDISYKKWGKMYQSVKHVLDLFPINNIAGDTPLPYENFLPKAAALLPDGYIYPFDQYPHDSRITYGKYGEYRKGYTDLHEVRIQHRQPMTGTITVEGSDDGTNLSSVINKSSTYENKRLFNDGYSLSARWYNITIEGYYDLIHLEARGSRAGRR